jgi:hypothetical protein
MLKREENKMKRFLIYFSSVLIVLGASATFAGVYVEDFGDGLDTTIWQPHGEYTVSNGVLHMYEGYDPDPTDENFISYSDVGFYNLSNEFVYQFEADILVAPIKDQIIGLTYEFREPEQGYYEQQVSIRMFTFDPENPRFFAYIYLVKENSTEWYYADMDIGPATYNEWHHFSITMHKDFVTIGVDNTEMNLFEGLHQDPEKFNWYGSYVHGTGNLEDDVNYKVDNLKAFTSSGTSPNDILDSVITSVDEWIEDGKLVGVGEGRPAERRLNIFENILGRAQNLFNNGNIIRACNQLRIASNRSDGQFPPPDLVEGDAVQDLQKMISILRTDIGCE